MNRDKFDAIRKKYAGHPEFIGLEIEHVNQPGAVDDTLLHLVARTGQLDEVADLIECGANPNQAGDLGNTPLHQAAMMGRAGAVQLLLRAGANVSIKNEFGQTAADVARIGKRDEVVELLKSRKG
jgi:uncharacterized protein